MTELATAKVPAYTAKTLRDRSVVQSQIARAEAHVRSARAFLYDVFEEAYDDAVAGRRPTMKTKAMLQLASTNAVLASADAVDLVHAAVGASGIRREYAFQKYFRDIHVITQHGFICASRYESVGQILMGLEPEWPFFLF
jgi:alkylation response protein AidB-like acyl-CoA dehydrogenase